MPDPSCSCCKALWVKFTLIQKLTTTDAFKSAVVYDDGSERHFWQGEDPDPDDAGFSVYNLEEKLTTPGFYKFSGEAGDVGLACLDESLPDTDRYRIVSLNVDDDLVHFELTADLTLSSSATATILVWSGTAWAATGATITVYDWYSSPGMWQAYSGYRGLAIHSRQSQRYEVVWMETRARSIEFTLTTDMASGSATASVNNYYLQGKNPLSGQNTTLTVYDAQGNYPRALSGAKGKARWNDRNRRYEIVECDQMAIAIRCNLSADMCVGTEEGTFDRTQTIVLTFPPYGQMPNPKPTTAKNTYGLAGKNGDYCLVLWDETHDWWVIAQVQHHQKEFITDIRYDSGQGCGAIQVKKQEVSVMVCKDETGWQDKIQLTEQEFVYNIGKSDVSGSGQNSGTQSCAITATKAKVCGFGAPVVTGTSNVIQLLNVQVVTGIGVDADSLYAIARTIYVVCVGASNEYDVIGITDCESGSGSGSGSGGQG